MPDFAKHASPESIYSMHDRVLGIFSVSGVPHVVVGKHDPMVEVAGGDGKISLHVTAAALNLTDLEVYGKNKDWADRHPAAGVRPKYLSLEAEETRTRKNLECFRDAKELLLAAHKSGQQFPEWPEGNIAEITTLLFSHFPEHRPDISERWELARLNTEQPFAPDSLLGQYIQALQSEKAERQSRNAAHQAPRLELGQ